jgi:uncharacterized protein YcbK (DUF882 family)
MARGARSDRASALYPSRAEGQKTRSPRLRIVIAGDPRSPLRTISLPRALPVVVSLIAAGLLIATVVLALGSWRKRAALVALEGRVREMVNAADSVALGPASDGAAPRAPHGEAPLRTASGQIGRFDLQVVNTGEEMTVTFDLGTGEVEAAAYRRLRHLMRCQRTGAETPVDPRLVDLLYRIAQRTKQKILLVSGFRAPMFSLATLSYHTRGMAADIRIPGMTALMTRDLVMSMNVPGIGYYPVSGFVHVDVRDETARWTDYGQNRQDGEGSEHGPGAEGVSPVAGF